MNFVSIQPGPSSSISPSPEAVRAAPAFTDYATYRAHGGYALAAALVNGEEDRRSAS